MIYTASDIIKRALQMSDLSNTDFVSHEEHTHIINESWREFYQALINMNDAQFIKEVELMNGYGGTNDYTEYTLPNDLYQIRSVKNKYTGSIVTRHAESEGINSNSYEVVNDRLRLYGVAQNPLLLTYWATPTYISFPDKDLDVELPSGYSIVSPAKDSVLLQNGDDFIIKNIKTNETISSFTIDNFTGTNVKLGNGHFTYVSGNNVYYADLTGNVIDEYDNPNDCTYHFFHDEDYNVCYQVTEDGGETWSYPFLMSTKLTDDTQQILFMFYDHTVYNVSTPTVAKIQVDDWAPIELPFTPTDVYDVVPLFDGKDSFIMLDQFNKIYRFVIEEDHIEMYQLNIKAPLFYCLTAYGILTGNGSNYTLKSNIPETEFNFPNSLFASAIAASCGVKYCMKQNSSNEGLQALYDKYLFEYKNSLDQNSSYGRIQNVYN